LEDSPSDARLLGRGGGGDAGLVDSLQERRGRVRDGDCGRLAAERIGGVADEAGVKERRQDFDVQLCDVRAELCGRGDEGFALRVEKARGCVPHPDGRHLVLNHVPQIFPKQPLDALLRLRSASGKRVASGFGSEHPGHFLFRQEVVGLYDGPREGGESDVPPGEEKDGLLKESHVGWEETGGAGEDAGD